MAKKKKIDESKREKEILDMMSRNGYTREEAEDIWLWDNDETIETEETAEAAKNWKAISRTAHDSRTIKNPGEKKEKQKRERTPNDIKRDLINAFKECLEFFDGVTNIEVTNVEKYITFVGPDKKHYTLNLVWNRKIDKEEK